MHLRCLLPVAPLALALVTSNAAAAEYAPSDDTIVADDGLRSFRATYEQGHAPGRREPRYLRAALEMGVVLGVGTAYYWIRPELSHEDWDFPDWSTRMSHLSPRFDSNHHGTNHVLHPFAGSLYYGLARVNGLSIPVSLGYSFASSAFFEFLLEWLEKASINDLIYTPMGGFPAGEFFLHLGDYFNSAPSPAWHHKASGVALGLPHVVHRAIDDPPNANTSLPADSLGYSSFFWHRFDALFGAGTFVLDTGRATWLQDVRLQGEIVAIPGFLRPGRFSVVFTDGEHTEARLHASIGGGRQTNADLSFQASLAGQYRQDIRLIEGRRVGHAWMLAVDSSMRVVDRQFFDFHDAYAMAHLLGPALKVWSVKGALIARFDVATHFDFAAVESLAYPSFTERFGRIGTKTVLQDHGYAYTIGTSWRVRGALEYRGIELGARAFAGTYESIDRWDRFQEEVTNDAHSYERVLETEAWFGFTVPTAPFHVRAFVERLDRRSELGPIVVTRSASRFGFLVGARF